MPANSLRKLSKPCETPTGHSRYLGCSVIARIRRQATSAVGRLRRVREGRGQRRDVMKQAKEATSAKSPRRAVLV